MCASRLCVGDTELLETQYIHIRRAINHHNLMDACHSQGIPISVSIIHNLHPTPSETPHSRGAHPTWPSYGVAQHPWIPLQALSIRSKGERIDCKATNPRWDHDDTWIRQSSLDLTSWKWWWFCIYYTYMYKRAFHAGNWLHSCDYTSLSNVLYVLWRQWNLNTRHTQNSPRKLIFCILMQFVILWYELICRIIDSS